MDAITEKTTFVDDLGVDSLDFFQILIDLEETFDVRIAPEEAEEIVTVGDAVETLRRVTKEEEMENNLKSWSRLSDTSLPQNLYWSRQ